MTTNGLKISEMLYSSLEDAINDDAQVPVSVDINGVKANRRVPIQLIQGYQGEGVQGVQGVQGNQGIAGIGTQGNQGNQGAVGSGVQGTQGNQGSDGVGIQGNQGNQGNQGAIGAGTQGYQGNQGVAGVTDAILYPLTYLGSLSSPYTLDLSTDMSGVSSGSMFMLEPENQTDYHPSLTFDNNMLTFPIGYTVFILMYMQCGGGFTTFTMTNPLGNTASTYIANTFDSETLRVVRIVRCLSGWAVM